MPASCRAGVQRRYRKWFPDKVRRERTLTPIPLGTESSKMRQKLEVAAWENLCGFFSFATFAQHFLYNLGHMSAPAFKRIPTFAEKFVALIDCRYPGDRAGLVIENLIGNVWSNPQASHSRDTCPAQVVKTPSGNLGKLVKFAFGSGKVLEWFGPMASKYVSFLPFHPLQDGDRLIRKMHHMGLGILGT